jgi:hypothetical protein
MENRSGGENSMGSIRKHMALSCNCVNDNNEEEG